MKHPTNPERGPVTFTTAQVLSEEALQAEGRMQYVILDWTLCSQRRRWNGWRSSVGLYTTVTDVL